MKKRKKHHNQEQPEAAIPDPAQAEPLVSDEPEVSAEPPVTDEVLVPAEAEASTESQELTEPMDELLAELLAQDTDLAGLPAEQEEAPALLLDDSGVVERFAADKLEDKPQVVVEATAPVAETPVEAAPAPPPSAPELEPVLDLIAEHPS